MAIVPGDRLKSLGSSMQRVSHVGPADVSDFDTMHEYSEYEHRRRTQILGGYEPNSAFSTSHGIVYPTDVTDWTGAETSGFNITGTTTALTLYPGVGVTPLGVLCDIYTALNISVTWVPNELNRVVYDPTPEETKYRKNRYHVLAPVIYQTPETVSDRIKTYGQTEWDALDEEERDRVLVLGGANVDGTGLTVTSWDWTVRSWFSVQDVAHRNRTDNPHGVTSEQLDMRNQVSFRLGDPSLLLSEGDWLPGGRIRVPDDGGSIYRYSVTYKQLAVQANVELISVDSAGTATVLDTMVLVASSGSAVYYTVESDLTVQQTVAGGTWLAVRVSGSGKFLQYATATVELLVNQKV